MIDTQFSHFNSEGRANMIDLSKKEESIRIAVATSNVEMNVETLEMIDKGDIAKGDVLGVAQVAGIMAAKKVPDLIPMCHPLEITSININFEKIYPQDNSGKGIIKIKAVVKNIGRTGVEMEAITAVTITALTIYDMCKAVDRWIKISDIYLLEKSGGKSGHVVNPDFS